MLNRYVYCKTMRSANGPSSNSNNSTSAIASMDALYDSLLVLGYQQHLQTTHRQSLSRLHFAIESAGSSSYAGSNRCQSGPATVTRRAQFLDALALAQWLINSIAPTARADFADKGEKSANDCNWSDAAICYRIASAPYIQGQRPITVSRNDPQ